MKNQFVAYLRVSTKKQFLGVEAQEKLINDHLKANNGVLLASFTEKETGTRKKTRIAIFDAIKQCKANNATLIVAKVDRLARDVQFIYALKNSGINFICLDVPDMNPTVLGILAVIAEEEAKTIQSRIVKALDAKRRRGEKLGNIKNLEEHRQKAVEASVATRRKLAEVKNQQVTGLICDYRKSGWGFSAIADRLNSLGFKTSTGKKFHPGTVQILSNRYCK